MQLVVVGVSHNSSSVSLRERLAVEADALPLALDQLRARVAEGFILSTCNRVELYAVCGHETTGVDLLRELLAARGNLTAPTIRDASYSYGHRSAVRHLLRVAAGLDSLVLGEQEIAGQLRRAVGVARSIGATGPMLDRLADVALACGKRVRSATALGSRGASVASVALGLVERDHGRIHGANVVILGAGDTAGQVLSQLATRHGIRVTLVNRDAERAHALAEPYGAAVRPWSALASTLTDADLVVGCTASPTPVVDIAGLSAARGSDNTRPLVCLDLGVPRDIDPAVTSLQGVALVDMARLEADTQLRDSYLARDVARAEAVVAEETERYLDWWRGRGVASTVTRLHEHAGAIRDAELARALARLPELTGRERAVVTDLVARVVGKLLHAPTVALKRDPEGANMAMVVERLFELARQPIARDHHVHTERTVCLEPQPESLAS